MDGQCHRLLHFTTALVLRVNVNKQLQFDPLAPLWYILGPSPALHIDQHAGCKRKHTKWSNQLKEKHIKTNETINKSNVSHATSNQLTRGILKLDHNQWLRVAGGILPCRVEKVRESVPRNKLNLAHILLVLWRLSHTRHPHLAQPGRVLRLDVLSQLLGHLLRQLVDLFKVVGQPVRLWVQVKEDTRAARPEPITVLR